MEPQIIYEDGDIVIVNKPSGLLTHAKHPNDTEDTLVSWFKKTYPDLDITQEPDIEAGIERTGIVHRLDRETSGLIILAKTKEAIVDLKQKFKNREIKKTYLALVYGHPQQGGTISSALGKIGNRQSTRIHGKRELEERQAITHFIILKEFLGYSLLEINPETGRTHQIRVHLKSIGYPIVCDSFYAPKKECPSDLNRLFLHASGLKFITPSGKAFQLETDLPDSLLAFLSSLKPIAKETYLG